MVAEQYPQKSVGWALLDEPGPHFERIFLHVEDRRPEIVELFAQPESEMIFVFRGYLFGHFLDDSVDNWPQKSCTQFLAERVTLSRENLDVIELADLLPSHFCFDEIIHEAVTSSEGVVGFTLVIKNFDSKSKKNFKNSQKYGYI